MEPWYKVATPRKEVREGRSFNPDEFAIALEQVVAGTAPEDYRDPEKFFSRTCFTRALRDHAAMVLRRLAGITADTAPVLTLITQFGGGKTHTLTALYHLVGQASGLSSQAGSLRHNIGEWTKHRGNSPRLYPASLIWCVKKPGRELREKVELWLAWKRVAGEIAEGTLGTDFDRAERAEMQSKVADAEDAAKDEVWASYRFVMLADNREPDGLKVIDLGAGHASAAETLCGRIITALKSQALLNESVGAGYIERNWPSALQESGAWPLASLRQSFLNGALTRLLDPDAVLRSQVVKFVEQGEFGLASGPRPDGTYDRLWYHEPLPPEEVTFDAGVFLLTKVRAKALKAGVSSESTSESVPRLTSGPAPRLTPEGTPVVTRSPAPTGATLGGTRILRLVGTVPPEVWNRLGTKILPKLRLGSDLQVGVNFSVTVNAEMAGSLVAELRQILHDLGLTGQISMQEERPTTGGP